MMKNSVYLRMDFVTLRDKGGMCLFVHCKIKMVCAFVVHISTGM